MLKNPEKVATPTSIEKFIVGLQKGHYKEMRTTDFYQHLRGLYSEGERKENVSIDLTVVGLPRKSVVGEEMMRNIVIMKMLEAQTEGSSFGNMVRDQSNSEA